MNKLVDIVEDNKKEMKDEIYKQLMEEIMEIKNKHRLKKEFYEVTLEITKPKVDIDGDWLSGGGHSLRFDSKIKKIIIPRDKIESRPINWTIKDAKKKEGHIVIYDKSGELSLRNIAYENEKTWIWFHKREINGKMVNFVEDCPDECSCDSFEVRYNGVRMLKIELISE